MSDASSAEQVETANNEPNPKTKSILDAKFTRRKFLKGAAVVAAGLVASRIPDIPSQIPRKEQSESKESISYAPSITILDAAPSMPTEGLIQKEFISNEQMIRNMLGDKYVSNEQLIQQFGQNYEEKWDEVIAKYPQALVYRLVDRYFNHGEKVTRVMESTLERSGLQSTGINILPLQKIFDKDSIKFIKDSSGNSGVSLNFDPKRIIKLLEGDPNRVINASFQVGNVELFQEVHKQLGVVREYDKFDDPRRYPLPSVFDGDKVFYYPGGVTNEKDGIYTGKYYDAEGKEVEPITLEDFESGRVKNSELKIVKFNELALVGAYTKAKAMENLSKLFEVANAYPNKFFVFAGGNNGEDFREAIGRLRDQVPKNLLIVAEWAKADYGGFKYEGTAANVFGPDIYVNNRELNHPSGSSFSVAVISAEVEMLLRKGFSFEQVKEAIFKKSDLHTLGLNDGINSTVRVFNPQLLGDK